MPVRPSEEAAGASTGRRREMLATMCLIRAFEERTVQLYNGGEVRGAVHSSAGQEAVAVGTAAALDRGDWLAATHRGHGHAIAKGADLSSLFAELLGRSGGFCRGKGGSMHVADLGCGMLGANGIVGASAELALGAAFAAWVRGDSLVAVAVLGDGGMAEGAVHEAFNLAALWSLPAIFLCENNQYAVTLSVSRGIAAAPIGRLAEAHGIPAAKVDGMDPEAVRAAMAAAVSRAREGAGPSFIEADTYRFMGHSRGDPNYGPYRDRDEWDAWRKRDPIPRLAAAAGLADELTEIEAEAQARIEVAVETALASPPPDLGEALSGVFPSGIPADLEPVR